MDYIRLKARAKINLAIDVLGKRSDGYHDLRTIMQSLTLHDNILIKKYHKAPLKIITNVSRLPVDSRNLVYKAADFLIKEYKLNTGVLIDLEKNIPISAGLAGGSSDCAAVLVGMRKLFELDISNAELFEMGKLFGADVPFCIMRGTALAEGIGDKLTSLPPHPIVHVLLAKPPVSVSTATVFNAFDTDKYGKKHIKPDMDKLLQAIKDSDLTAISRLLCNSLESVTEEMHPVIPVIKRIMLENNAMGAMMSGSGPTVFGYFQDRKEALLAMEQIRNRIDTVRDLYITGVFNNYTKINL